MYNIDGKYLFEIIEDYKEEQSCTVKAEIFSAFCDAIWNCPNRPRVFVKTIRYDLEPGLQNTELGQIFENWSVVEYYGFRSLTSQRDYASLIRQKINNLYIKLFHPKVILNKEYLDLLKVPKTLYYAWRKGREFTPKELTALIDGAMDSAQAVKARYEREKMVLAWNNYKKMIETYLERAFQNCKFLEELEYGKQMVLDIDCWNEDNLYIRYLCKSLDGELRKYQKNYYGVRDHHKLRRCRDCGRLYEVNRKDTRSTRCGACYNVHRKFQKRAAQNLRRRRMKSEQNPAKCF